MSARRNSESVPDHWLTDIELNELPRFPASVHQRHMTVNEYIMLVAEEDQHEAVIETASNIDAPPHRGFWLSLWDCVVVLWDLLTMKGKRICWTWFWTGVAWLFAIGAAGGLCYATLLLHSPHSK